MKSLKLLVLLLITLVISLSLMKITLIAAKVQRNKVIIVRTITDYLILAPVALRLNYPILLEGDISKKTFLRYYPSSTVLKVDIKDIASYLDFIFSHFTSSTLIIINTTNLYELTMISVFASRKLHPLFLINKESELKLIVQRAGNRNLICFRITEDILKKQKISYKLVDLNYFMKGLNDQVVQKELLVIGISDDQFLPLLAYYVGARKCLVKLFTLNELLNSKELSTIIKERKIRKLVLVASLNSLRKSPGKGNLVNIIYKSAIEAYEDRYLKVSVGVLSGVTLEDALAFIMRNLFYDRLIGQWKKRLVAIYMSEGMALAKKIFRIATNVNLTVDRVVSEKARMDEYEKAVRALSSGSLITYINLHGNPLAMSPMQIGPILFSGVKYGRKIPYIPPTIILTFSCDTAKFHHPYLREPEESIALSFIARGAVAYVGATTLEFSSGIEIDTAHTELILTLLFQGKELGDIVRIVNNIHIASNKNVEPHLAAYTVLLGDPLLKIKPMITEKLYSLEIIEPNKRYVIKVLTKTPVIYLEIPVNIKSSDIKSVEIIDRNVVSWNFVEKFGEKSLICIFMTRELSLEIGDFEPGDIIKVKVIIRESEWVIYLIPIVIIAIAIIISLVEKRKSRF